MANSFSSPSDPSEFLAFAAFLFAAGLDGLTARVVELARLADGEPTGSQNQDLRGEKGAVLREEQRRFFLGWLKGKPRSKGFWGVLLFVVGRGGWFQGKRKMAIFGAPGLPHTPNPS